MFGSRKSNVGITRKGDLFGGARKLKGAFKMPGKSKSRGRRRRRRRRRY